MCFTHRGQWYITSVNQRTATAEKASAGAGCGEGVGGSNDLWFGSHAYSADFTHHSYLKSQNRPLGKHTTQCTGEES